MAVKNSGTRRKGTRETEGRAVVHDLVYQEIRHSIMIGTFAPGEKVSLRSLAQQVGTSLTPVRGAVNRLIAEGAFEVLPNRWIMIPTMSKEKFEEIVRWRIQLEMDATRRACRNVTKDLLNKVERINRTIHKIAEQGRDRDKLLTENYEFHFSLYRGGNSAILMPMIESLWLQCGPFTYYSMLSPWDLWDGRHHDAIIAALRSGDEDMAAKAVKSDITSTARFLRKNGQYTRPKLRRVLD